MNNYQITINSPGKQWFNREAVLINGIAFKNSKLRIKKPEGISNDLEIDPEVPMTRFQLDNLYHNKKTEFVFINNVLNVCEYYGIEHFELEKLIEMKAGFIPGWINDYLKDFGKPKKSINLQTMRIKAAILDEITGMSNGTGINLFVPSVLYYDFGLTYSIDEILYILPQLYKTDISRQYDNMKIAVLDLQAKNEYCRVKTQAINKTIIKFSKPYL